MEKRISIALAGVVVLATLAAWGAAIGLSACAAYAGESPAAPATRPSRVRVVAPKSPPADPDRAALPEPARAPLPPMPDEVSARGWFGMAFTCSECTIQARTGDSPPVWDFAEPPQVYRVEPGGPAERAGILPGDVLTKIDGTALDSAEGGRRFGAVEPGQKVRWTVRRGAATRLLTVVAGERPGQSLSRDSQLMLLDEQLARIMDQQDLTQMRREVERARAQMSQLRLERALRTRSSVRIPPIAQPLRYAGQIGCSNVDVRGAGAVNVTVSQDGDEIVISTGDATVRVKAGEKK